MIAAQTVRRAFPDIERIRDEDLRAKTVRFWEEVGRRNPIWEDPDRVPMHPQMLPIERHGSLANHQRAMASIAQTLVPVYKREWGIEFDLDHWLAAVHIHDAAKVVEFVEKDGAIVPTPGFNHALAAAKIALELGFPRPVAHMVACHTFIGPLILPRTPEAALFQFIDPLCLPFFPEHEGGGIVRHLKANGWEAPPQPPDVP